MLDTLGESAFSSKLDDLQNEFHTVCIFIKFYQFYMENNVVINDFVNEHVCVKLCTSCNLQTA